MRPMGLAGTKKLSDLFVDLKYSLVDKARSLVLELGDCGALVSPAGAHVGDSSSSGRLHGSHVGDSSAYGRPHGSHVGALIGERIDEALKIGPATLEIVRITVCSREGLMD